jgi:hypothetical protein
VRKKTILSWVIIGGVVAATLLLVAPPRNEASAPASAPRARVPQPGEQALRQDRFAALPSREAMGKPRGELFGPLAPPVTARASAPRPEAAPAPVAPPIPYRVAGQVVHDGAMHVILAKGDRVSTVRVGDVVDDSYRVEAITPDSVTLVYLPLKIAQQVQVSGMKLDLEAPAGEEVVVAASDGASAATGESRSAQLRWVGPERVQAGNNFNVSLKLTSEEPVLASPLQLTYDAKMLEPVAVRAGGFLAEGSFTYRVNPGGSIFVGAAAGAGSVATDAEFLIVTFKPIRSGPAELKLSSVVLQGADGRAIVHEPPASFRTAIFQ